MRCAPGTRGARSSDGGRTAARHDHHGGFPARVPAFQRGTGGPGPRRPRREGRPALVWTAGGSWRVRVPGTGSPAGAGQTFLRPLAAQHPFPHPTRAGPGRSRQGSRTGSRPAGLQPDNLRGTDRGRGRQVRPPTTCAPLPAEPLPPGDRGLQPGVAGARPAPPADSGHAARPIRTDRHGRRSPMPGAPQGGCRWPSLEASIIGRAQTWSWTAALAGHQDEIASRWRRRNPAVADHPVRCG